MQKFAIDKFDIGSEKHLIFDTISETISEAETIPDNILTFNTKKFDEILNLYCIETNTEIFPENIRKAYRAVQNPRTYKQTPWRFCMPSEAYKNIVNGFISTLGRQLRGIDIDNGYYGSIFAKTEKVLDSLYPAFINKDFLSDSTSTFQPNASGFVEKVIYSRTNSITGRISVESGPRILTTKKEDRKKIIGSRFGNDGVIVSLDFKSLEPRTIKAVSNNGGVDSYHQGYAEDIYIDVIDSCASIKNTNRETIKEVVLSELYGSGFDSLVDKLKMNEFDVRNLKNIVDDYFELDKLKHKLLIQAENTDRKYLENFYGRRVSIREAQPYMYVNYYTQSTAVDIAFLGFLNIINYLEELGRLGDTVFPLFVIHDELLLDFNLSAFHIIPTLCKIGSKEIKNLENNRFYIQQKVYDNRTDINTKL